MAKSELAHATLLITHSHAINSRQKTESEWLRGAQGEAILGRWPRERLFAEMVAGPQRWILRGHHKAAKGMLNTREDGNKDKIV